VKLGRDFHGFFRPTLYDNFNTFKCFRHDSYCSSGKKVVKAESMHDISFPFT
jgi:hypothetical protein